jgi:Na+-transporting NADH:ubiquinone oxidoreductase subunit NqrC
MGIAMVFVFVVLVAGVFVMLGYVLAEDKLAADRAELDQQRQVLDAEWTALENTQRVRSVFLAARRAMQREAQSRRLGAE